MKLRISKRIKVFLIGVSIIVLLYFVGTLEDKLSDGLYTSIPSTETIKDVASLCKTTLATSTTRIKGINVTEPTDPKSRELLSDLNVEWVRTDIHWERIEQTPGEYDWSTYDEIFTEMNEKGISIAPIFSYIPSYLTNWQIIGDEYGQFVGLAALRYHQYGLHYYEIFNEPNLSGFGWLQYGIDPEPFINAYGLLLAKANIAIRTEDPHAVIILGGLSPNGYSADNFLNRIYDLGLAGCFDIVAYHPYGEETRLKERAEEIRTIMTNNGDSEKPIWFNELGSNKVEDQERIMKVAFLDIDAVQGFFWFNLRDFKSPFEHYGLVDREYHTRSSYNLFKKLLEELANQGKN